MPLAGKVGRTLLIAAQLVCAVILTTRTLERKGRWSLRLVGVGAAGGLFILMTTLLNVDPSETDIQLALSPQGLKEANETFAIQFVVFGLAAALCVASVLALFSATLPAALFCVSEAYVLQNVASGFFGLVLTCVPLFGIDVSAWWLIPLGMVGLFAVVYAIGYRAFLARIDAAGLLHVRGGEALALMSLVALICLVFDLANKCYLSFLAAPVGVTILYQLTQLAMCALLLWMEFELVYNQRLERSVAVLNRMHVDEKRQYELFRQTVDAINIKAHDLRHQIRHLKKSGALVDQSALDQLARDVAIYDAAIDTGNDVLGTILVEKNLICVQKHIRLTCMVDGAALSFMNPEDAYSLFGNMLDNAIEAVGQLDERGRRSVSLLVERKGQMVVIHEENWFAGEVVFEDGLPQTTKGDLLNHGYGTRSIREVVSRYDGSLAMRASDGHFELNVLLPRA